MGARTRRALQNGLTRSIFKTRPLPSARGQERSLGPWASQWRTIGGWRTGLWPAIGEGPVTGTQSRCRASGLPFGIHSPKAPRLWIAFGQPLGRANAGLTRSIFKARPLPSARGQELSLGPWASQRRAIGGWRTGQWLANGEGPVEWEAARRRFSQGSRNDMRLHSVDQPFWQIGCGHKHDHVNRQVGDSVDTFQILVVQHKCLVDLIVGV